MLDGAFIEMWKYSTSMIVKKHKKVGNSQNKVSYVYIRYLNNKACSNLTYFVFIALMKLQIITNGTVT